MYEFKSHSQDLKALNVFGSVCLYDDKIWVSFTLFNGAKNPMIDWSILFNENRYEYVIAR